MKLIRALPTQMRSNGAIASARLIGPVTVLLNLGGIPVGITQQHLRYMKRLTTQETKFVFSKSYPDDGMMIYRAH
jgi:hypothetical protein